MGARILCIGDLHLGRTPSRIPRALEEEGIRVADLTPAAAWRRAVDRAIELEVDALVLAGDVVESMNQRHEAFRHLEVGVRRLVEAGIAVCAVAGNHDVEALPRLARLIDGFHLLGEGGQWSDFVLERDSQPQVRFLGWSFPRSRFSASPLVQRPSVPADGVPLVGLLHCDLDASDSRYAPVRRSQLDEIPTAAWLLGHVHKPSLKPGEKLVGYLGSLVGLDPSESGDHCGWLLTVSAGADPKLERVSLAPLRWEKITFDVTGIPEAADDLFERLVGELRAHVAGIEEQLEGVRAVGVRVSITGRSDDLRQLAAAAKKLIDLAPVVPVGERFVFFDKVTLDAGVAYDLADLAAGSDPPALLAQDLRRLRTGVAASRELIAKARRDLETRAGAAVFSALGHATLGDEKLREILLRAGEAALEELLSQQEQRR